MLVSTLEHAHHCAHDEKHRSHRCKSKDHSFQQFSSIGSHRTELRQENATDECGHEEDAGNDDESPEFFRRTAESKYLAPKSKGQHHADNERKHRSGTEFEADGCSMKRKEDSQTRGDWKRATPDDDPQNPSFIVRRLQTLHTANMSQLRGEATTCGLLDRLAPDGASENRLVLREVVFQNGNGRDRE
jgi:hypothetical protein